MRSVIPAGLLALGTVLATSPLSTPAQAPTAVPGPETRDGRADFNFEIGRWRTQVKRLRKPLSGSTRVGRVRGHEYRAPVSRRWRQPRRAVGLWAGRAHRRRVVRLYHPETRQWSVHYAGAADGELTAPLYGRFDGGRGEFLGDDTFGGRPIRVRFVISQIDADTARFEQAFSTDGGKTWEVNWIATDTRF